MTATLDVALDTGIARGTHLGAVSRFSAIPYAQPPVGRLRFAPPEPAEWHGVLDATRPGAIAPQLPSRLREVMGDFHGDPSEDCLHLTVWTPGADDARRPVVVWVHGGAWQTGASALPWYDGARLAEEGDVVVVAIQYRLAALGWLTLPGITANLGLLDQEMAIDWVFRHIAAFGGDPERITAMGQSAGGSCVAALCGRTPRFRRAILQSASLGRGLRQREVAHQLGAAYLEATGASDAEALRQVPLTTLLEAQQSPVVREALTGRDAGLPFTLVADGVVLPLDYDGRLAAAASSCDVLVGYTAHEMAAFPGFGRDDRSQAAGDAIFGAPARQWASDAVRAGRRAWLYRLDLAPTTRFGACHCIDLPLMFGNLEAFADAPMLEGADTAHLSALSASVRWAWLDFIRGGSPGWGGAPAIQVLG